MLIFNKVVLALVTVTASTLAIQIAQSANVFYDSVDIFAYQTLSAELAQYFTFVTLSNLIFGDIFYLQCFNFFVLASTSLLKISRYRFTSYSDIILFPLIVFTLTIVTIQFSFVLIRSGTCLAFIILSLIWAPVKFPFLILAMSVHFKSAPYFLIRNLYLRINKINWLSGKTFILLLLSILVVFSSSRGDHLISGFHDLRLALFVLVPMFLILIRYTLQFCINDYLFWVYLISIFLFLLGFLEQAGEAYSRGYVALATGSYLLTTENKFTKRWDIVFLLSSASLFFIRGWLNHATNTGV